MSLNSQREGGFLRYVMGPYISEQAAVKLKQYKYAGGDNGIVYKLFYNPLAIKLVSYLPETLA
jgi:hypothetical protein